MVVLLTVQKGCLQQGSSRAHTEQRPPSPDNGNSSTSENKQTSKQVITQKFLMLCMHVLSVAQWCAVRQTTESYIVRTFTVLACHVVLEPPVQIPYTLEYKYRYFYLSIFTVPTTQDTYSHGVLFYRGKM